jgi:dienelactone hydrolase
VAALAAAAGAQPPATGPVLHLDFAADVKGVRFLNGAKRTEGKLGGAIEFNNPLQLAEIEMPAGLDGVEAATIGGWFMPRRSGEQLFLFRGVPEVAPQGERMFRPSDKWVNFVLGTDHRGLFMGALNGNGSMPFVHVTIDEVPINCWSQMVLVKDRQGHQKFYRNGVLVHTDRDAAAAGKVWPFHDKDKGEPVRVAAPMGGLAGEVWVYGRELTPEEIAGDFDAKKGRYHPALPPRPAGLREMNAHPRAGLWKAPITTESWPKERERILAGMSKVFGPMPKDKPPLDARVHGEEDCGSYIRRKVSIQVQPGDRMPAYLLIPRNRSARKVPAIICFYGTTSGAGKETTVGLSGARPGSKPERNRAFAIDMVEAGFVAFAADYLRDGERITPGKRPYDTTEFYEKFPDWSIHGKDAWDNMRAIDYLQSLDFVDRERIGMVGHSYGGHSTIFAAALDERIKAAWANGPVSDFRGHGMHWAVPKGAGASQSLPGMRPYVLDHTLPIPVEFYEIEALIAPRPLVVAQAAGERRPMDEESYAAVGEVYRALGAGERARFLWYAGDHDFPPVARRAAVEFFKRYVARATSPVIP